MVMSARVAADDLYWFYHGSMLSGIAQEIVMVKVIFVSTHLHISMHTYVAAGKSLKPHLCSAKFFENLAS